MSNSEQIGKNPAKILAISIGVKDYNDKKMHRLVSAENNAYEFEKSLVLARRHKSANPLTLKEIYNNTIKKTDGATNSSKLRSDVKTFIDDSISRQSDIELVVFYYSGHSALDVKTGKYYLTVTETKEDDLIGTAWEVSDLFDVLGRSNKKTIVILDSCFSENAFDFFSGRNDYYIIASSAYNQTSKYPVNDDHSVFTATFLEIVNKGISGAGDYLTYAHVFEETKRILVEKGLPAPKFLDRNGAGDSIACENNCNAVAAPEEPEFFDMRSAMIKIHRRLFRNGEIDDATLKENVLNSYPNVISIFLANLMATYPLLYDAPFISDFYKQIIGFLSFIFIRDLRDNQKLSPEHMIPFNAWTKEDFAHEDKVEIVKIALHSYKSVLFIQNIKGDILYKVNQLESLLPTLIVASACDKFRNILFSLIEDLSFFKDYELLAVRFISVKKSFYNCKKFKHEVSNLYGTHLKNYAYKNKENQCFESDNDFLNNAVVLISKCKGDELNEVIQKKSYLNLWPFLIDGCCNMTNASIPQLCMFLKIEYSGNDRHYRYSILQLMNERRAGSKDYTELAAFPETDEWDQYCSGILNTIDNDTDTKVSQFLH